MDNWTIQKIVDNFDLDENFVFFDLGTHLGQELEAFLPLGVEVHSFEPHPELVKYIKENFKDYDNLIFNESAAWIKDEVRDLYFKKDPISSWRSDDGSSLLKEKQNLSGQYSASVKCVDIAEYVFSLNKQIDVVKLDTEGAEYHIISHLIETKAIDRIDNLFFEDHSRRFPHQFSEYFQNKEFIFQKINDLNTNFGVWQ